ncbi:MAG: hypothetical protein QOJ04_6508 [Caballeronia sp.]|nr:hypothetical protein [Caballeronia sp.]
MLRYGIPMPKLEFQGDVFDQDCPQGAAYIALDTRQDCVYCIVYSITFHNETTEM